MKREFAKFNGWDFIDDDHDVGAALDHLVQQISRSAVEFIFEQFRDEHGTDLELCVESDHHVAGTMTDCEPVPLIAFTAWSSDSESLICVRAPLRELALAKIEERRDNYQPDRQSRFHDEWRADLKFWGDEFRACAALFDEAAQP
jgi:hypothetical protein